MANKSKKSAKRSTKITPAKAEIIRKMVAKEKSSADIMAAVKKAGHKSIYYSEISRVRAEMA